MGGIDESGAPSQASSSAQAQSPFRFAETPPGARPGDVSRIPPARTARGPASQFGSQSGATPQKRAHSYILEEDWAEDYAQSPAFSQVWDSICRVGGEWPEGYKVFRGKLYSRERLCVPENLVQQVLSEHHDWVAHVGTDRLLVEVLRRYAIPEGIDTKKILQKVRRNCLVCQACDRPNWAMQRPISMTPIPDRVMVSVCLDVFTMPISEWQGQKYDAYLLCVDRHSGWMVARPTQKQGLTGEKAAHLMLDGSWGRWGYPRS